MKLQLRPKQQTNFLTCPGVKELPVGLNKSGVGSGVLGVKDQSKDQLRQQAPFPAKGGVGGGSISAEADDVLDSVTRLQQNEIP